MIQVDITLPRKNFDVIIKEEFTDGITGIYGPSGSGKTSLLHAISGLASPTNGTISIDKRTVFNKKENINIPVNRRNIGYVFQEGRLFPHMSVEKNLLYGHKKIGNSKVDFNEVVDLLNLKHLLKSNPTHISGGERQRTALGRSLLSSPDILLLDEPFSAVDTRLRSQILPFILRIQQKVQIPILVVSHDIPDLLKLTNQLCIIQEGQCIGNDEYYNLLKQKEVNHIFGTGSIVNAVNLEVVSINALRGLTILSKPGSDNSIKVKCEKSNSTYGLGQKLKIFINADDIAIARNKIEDITIQNQIQGTVTDIVERESSNLCIVDVGFRLVVEITAESAKRMEITQGSEVWCLFKSVAIDVAG